MLSLSFDPKPLSEIEKADILTALKICYGICNFHERLREHFLWEDLEFTKLRGELRGDSDVSA